MGLGVQRNKPCICGSKRKFKKCCLGIPKDQIRYVHEHLKDKWAAICLTCREIEKEGVTATLPASTEAKVWG